ncbi:Uncharacterized conserved protein, Ntn-hydrolase superfamily [Georgenia satyanarayanai]|uniref:Uncharacterized conserved protein, Ntn-hydrolase superfamily n=1 Tax=Georgenia satyanarayanai TaxID=860221 RepID=A0A2Y8ZXX5_9MICO|nr:DUF1028 domain-containing protein [Georgenia satyanarayanai]PYG01596.1 putative Ntn-hydrolase superfamily protein [Georgenia satyanarayanai]SSA36396.1 Uncharacterized conserved protein, Ntn-hydrolase superfamily [Georgenia satyanarayanai]
MTYSIVARSGDSLGVATATCTLAVGAAVPAAAPGVGAVATQARTNRAFRARGLKLLRAGAAPDEVLAAFAQEDTAFGERQVAVLDADGRGAVWTGPECLAWAGGWVRPDVVVAGNLLAGREVLEKMDAAFAAHPSQPLADRLLAALAAGEDAGGDRRGRQSAALLVVAGPQDCGWPPPTIVDLRVDDHADPVGELGRLLALDPAAGSSAGAP